MGSQFPLPPIEDAALKKFCAEHDLYETVAAGYHYAHKFSPQRKRSRLISIRLIAMMSRRKRALHSWSKHA
ncbi:hypothetical protein IH992_19415 [Candidatus Poribacteria bacterium]|nr:hypothetical protein [Candidatus Poribacteria bacterium]